MNDLDKLNALLTEVLDALRPTVTVVIEFREFREERETWKGTLEVRKDLRVGDALEFSGPGFHCSGEVYAVRHQMPTGRTEVFVHREEAGYGKGPTEGEQWEKAGFTMAPFDGNTPYR